MSLLIHLFVSTLAVLIAAYVLPGVRVAGIFAALVTAIAFGFVNMFIKPVAHFIGLPLTVVTLGLFALVINALLILLVAAIVPGFDVDGFWWAVLFGIVLGIVNAVLGAGTR